MHRFRFPALSLLLVALATAACPEPGNPPIPGQQPSTQQADQTRDDQPKTYKIRFIFDGLLTFVTPDRSADPTKLWVLVGNATDPSKLIFGKEIAPHANYLLIEQKPDVRISGRKLQDLHLPHLGLGPDWKGVTLDNEDLRLEGDLQTPLSVVRGTGRPPHPCIPNGGDCTRDQHDRQQKDFEWIIEADEALARVQTRNPTTPQHRQLRACLVEETYGCRTETPLLSARLKLSKGRLFVQELFKDNSGKFITYNFGSRFPFDPRAAAREVAAEIDAVGPVQILSSPLNGSGGFDPIIVEANPNQTVTIRIGNHPTCSGIECRNQPDFLFHFNLITNPELVGEQELPYPAPISQSARNAEKFATSEFDEFDPQCSPGGFVGGRP
ncbi:MAG TPA: hypothetical protein VKK31_07750 [Thermoanaerobaculia bacterium]|nr:hypothetical protein [Thermoanaerobaculia bacterium]